MKNRQPPATKIDALIEALRNRNPNERRARASLAHEPCEAYLPSLLKATGDPDVYVRASAIHALANYDPDESEALLQTLCHSLADDMDASVRSAAAEVLAGMSADAVPALLAALEDTDAEVRKEVVHALAAFDTHESASSLTQRLQHDPDPEVRAAAVVALERTRPEGVVDALIRALDDANQTVRSAAASALAECEPRDTTPIVAALVSSLSDESALVRESAARALRYSSPEAADGLIALLRDEAPGVRGEAAAALGTLQAEQAIAPLAERLRHDDEVEVRGHAATALGAMGAGPATAYLIAAFHNERGSAEVRLDIVSALGSLGDAEALPALCSALQDPHADIREASARGLASLPLDPDTADSASVLEPLCAALADPEPGVREAASDALANLNDPRALPFLLDAAKAEANESRAALFEAISRIDAEAGTTLFLQGLHDPDTDVQRAAAKSLVLRKDAPVPPAVLARLADPEGDVFARCDLAQALARHAGAEAVPMLIELLEDESSYLRTAAAQALGGLSDLRAMGALLKHLDDQDEEVRGEVALALAALADDRLIEPLAQLLKDESPAVRRRAVRALSFFTASKVLPLLIANLEDEDAQVRSTAVSALAELCDAPALRRIGSALPPALDDTRDALEEAAAELEDEDPSDRHPHPRRVRLGTLHYE